MTLIKTQISFLAKKQRENEKLIDFTEKEIEKCKVVICALLEENKIYEDLMKKVEKDAIYGQ